MAPRIKFRWLGVAGIELTTSDQVLVIDPFFTRISPWQALLGRPHPSCKLVVENIPRCDFVLVTHAHWDHVLDVPAVVRSTGATALGSPNVCQLLAASGIPAGHICEIAAGDRLDLGHFQVEALPARHPTLFGRPILASPLPSNLRLPLRARDYRMDRCFSFLIDIDGCRVLDWTSVDTESPEMADMLWVEPYRFHRHYEALLGAVRPRVVIPIHWDDFFRPLSKPQRPMFRPPTLAAPLPRRVNLVQFQQAIAQIAPETRVVVPKMFRVYDLSGLAGL